MKHLLSYQCKKCAAPTQLSFKDEMGEDFPICVNCLVDLIEEKLDNYVDKMGFKHKSMVPFQLNQAIRICTEYADIKLQRIEPPAPRSHIARMALIVRSIINDQYYIKVIDVLDMEFKKVYPTIIETLAKWFPKNKYPEDLVPKDYLDENPAKPSNNLNQERKGNGK